MMMVIVVFYITILLQAGITLLTSIYHLASLKKIQFPLSLSSSHSILQYPGILLSPTDTTLGRGKKTVVT